MAIVLADEFVGHLFRKYMFLLRIFRFHQMMPLSCNYSPPRAVRIETRGLRRPAGVRQ